MNPESEQFQADEDDSSVDYIAQAEDEVAENEYGAALLRRSLDMR